MSEKRTTDNRSDNLSAKKRRNTALEKRASHLFAPDSESNVPAQLRMIQASEISGLYVHGKMMHTFRKGIRNL